MALSYERLYTLLLLDRVLGNHLWTLFGDDIVSIGLSAIMNVKTYSYYPLTGVFVQHTMISQILV